MLREKTYHFFPPTSSIAASMNLQNEQVSITYHAQLLYPPPIGTLSSSAPGESESLPRAKNEKHK
jgi:hypothetical protein